MRQGYKATNVLTKLRRRIDLTRLIFSFLSAAAFTVFTLIMLFKDWASSVYLYIVLGFILAYIAVFSGLIILVYSKRGTLSASLRDYKSGLKIMKAILRLISFSITVSVLSIAVFSNANTAFRFLVLISSVVWAVFQIFYQMFKLFKRHKKSNLSKRRKLKGFHAQRRRKTLNIKKRR